MNHPSVQLRPAAGSLLDVRRRRLSLDRAGRLLPNRSRGLVRRDTPRRGRVRGQLTLVKVAVLALEVLLEVDVVVVPPGQPNLSRLRAGTRGAARLEISDSLEFRSPLPEFSRQRIDVSLERHRAASLVVPNLAAAAATPRCLLIFVSALGLLRGFAPLLERGDVTEAQRGEAGELLREALEQLGLLPRRLQRQAGSGRPVVCSSQAGGGRERTRSLRILRCLALRGLRENTGVGVGGAMLGSDVLGSSSSPAFPGSLAAPHDTRILRWISAFSEGAAPRRVAPGRPSHRALEPTAAPAPPLRPTAGRSRPAPPRGGEARQACAILHCRSRPYRRSDGGSRRPLPHRKISVCSISSRWKFRERLQFLGQGPTCDS